MTEPEPEADAAVEAPSPEACRAVGHAIGYLAAAVSLPLLIDRSQGRGAAAMTVLLLAVLALLRVWTGAALRDALPPARALRLQRCIDAAAPALMSAADLVTSLAQGVHAASDVLPCLCPWVAAGASMAAAGRLRNRLPEASLSFPSPPESGHSRRSSAAF
jgi:hypothetical protein